MRTWTWILAKQVQDGHEGVSSQVAQILEEWKVLKNECRNQKDPRWEIEHHRSCYQQQEHLRSMMPLLERGDLYHLNRKVLLAIVSLGIS